MELAAEEVLRHLQFEIQGASSSQPWTSGWVERKEVSVFADLLECLASCQKEREGPFVFLMNKGTFETQNWVYSGHLDIISGVVCSVYGLTEPEIVSAKKSVARYWGSVRGS